MQIVKQPAKMQRLAKRWKTSSTAIALVPTMGYLHQGHLTLVARARKLVGQKGKVVVSIYVNPTQFGPTEDLSKYPRDFKRDCALCAQAGVDAIFAPGNADMYPGDRAGAFSTYVVEQQLSRSMEGVSRPTHFQGVTTVVAKLFNICLPDLAVFGAKDYQQAAIIQRMVRDLNFPLKIVIAPTHRETDGLAMSSRNKYLQGADREHALILSQALAEAQDAVKRTKSIPANQLKRKLARLIEGVPGTRLDYVEFFDPNSLEAAKAVKRGTHVALAVFVGSTRLIDNARL